MTLPANWQTTVSAIGTAFMTAVTFLASVSYDQGPIAMVIPVKYKSTITLLAGTAALVLWVWNGIQQKSKNVTGGTVQQTVSGAKADDRTQSLVDQTVIASIKSGDTAVTDEQKDAVKNLPL